MKQFICKNLSVGYEGKSVQEDINLSIDSGGFLCIVGRNGAGKSTLIKTILGLIPPISGSVEFGDGLKSTDVGYLPQQTQIQKDFPASVWEVVLSGCVNRHKMRCFFSKDEKNLAMEMLRKLDISELKKRTYSKLSGGQQQRVLLARALCATSKVLLLDEPVAGLDPTATSEMYKLIKKLNDEGITIIMITHDVDHGIEFSDYVLYLDDKSNFMGKNEYLNMIRGGGNE